MGVDCKEVWLVNIPIDVFWRSKEVIGWFVLTVVGVKSGLAGEDSSNEFRLCDLCRDGD